MSTDPGLIPCHACVTQYFIFFPLGFLKCSGFCLDFSQWGYSRLICLEKTSHSFGLLSRSCHASGAICGSHGRPGSPIHTLSLLVHLDGWGAICCKGSSAELMPVSSHSFSFPSVSCNSPTSYSHCIPHIPLTPCLFFSHCIYFFIYLFSLSERKEMAEMCSRQFTTLWVQIHAVLSVIEVTRFQVAGFSLYFSTQNALARSPRAEQWRNKRVSPVWLHPCLIKKERLKDWKRRETQETS